MDPITGITRGGTVWTPLFVVDLNQKKCIGCGRCFKVCPRSVFELVERGEDMEMEDEDFADDAEAARATEDALMAAGMAATVAGAATVLITHAVPVPSITFLSFSRPAASIAAY